MEDDADDEGKSLLLDDVLDNSGQVMVAFCPLTTTKLEPNCPFTG